MLSNAYFLAKFRFDTAENEPAKNLQNFPKFANFAAPTPLTLTPQRMPLRAQASAGYAHPAAGVLRPARPARPVQIRPRLRFFQLLF